MSKHTPGPWEVIEEMYSYSIVETITSQHIADDVARRYAHLIAAAPDMLAALKIVTEYLALKNLGGVGVYRTARAAIAKAKGE